MKAFNYLRYFLFLAVNWNLRIAFFIIYHEIKGEKKYNINSTGIDALKAVQKAGIDISHATLYMPVVYSVLEEAFEHLPVKRNHFLDMGCGKGRALCMAVHQGFKKISGIDFSAQLCEDAKKNIQSTQQKTGTADVKISNLNVLDYTIPVDVDCLFFFNPFDEIIMKVVVKNILDSLKKNKRNLTVIYVNPLHKELFTEAGFSETFYSKRFIYLELSVLKKIDTRQ